MVNNMDTKIINAKLVTCNDNDAVILDAQVHIKDGLIVYAGKSEGAPAADAAQVIDARGNAVLPAFFNMHTHLPMNIFRSYADDMTLMDWLHNRIFPAEDKLTAEMAYWGTMLAMCEMAAAGIVGFNEMYYFTDRIAEAALKSGMRGVIARAVVTPTEEMGEERLKESIELYKAYNGKGRVKIYFAPHAQYTVSNSMLEKIAQMAKDYGTGIHMHISETKGEHEACVAEHGKTPIALCESLGLLDVPFLAAHCVHVSDEDMDIMAKKGATALSCPRSNLKLGSGVARLGDMMKRGVRVSLGTDGAASNNKLSIMSEMTYACLLQKGVTGDPETMPAPQALKLATRGGAEAVGINSGVVEAGRNADIIMLKTDGVRYTPEYDAISNIVYAGSDADVCMTMVGGDIIYKDGACSFADVEEVRAKVNGFAALYRE